MQVQAQTIEMPRSFKLTREIPREEEEARRVQPWGMPPIAPLEGFDFVEYGIYSMEEDFLLVFKPATYKQELESTNSFVVTDPALTSLPVVLLVRTRERLAGVAVGLAGVGIIAFVGFPSPYNWVALLALLGPFGVVAYGLKSQS